MAIEFAGNPLGAAAWLYHAEARPQDKVAKILGVSRHTATKCPSEVRRRGLATIRLDPDILCEPELAIEFRCRLPLQGVHVVSPDPDLELLRIGV